MTNTTFASPVLYVPADRSDERERALRVSAHSPQLFRGSNGIQLREADEIDDVDVPLGLGRRRLAAAAITAMTDAEAIVVSQTVVVRLLDDGGRSTKSFPISGH